MSPARSEHHQLRGNYACALLGAWKPKEQIVDEERAEAATLRALTTSPVKVKGVSPRLLGPTLLQSVSKYNSLALL